MNDLIKGLPKDEKALGNALPYAEIWIPRSPRSRLVEVACPVVSHFF
jgi:hypothetical protein